MADTKRARTIEELFHDALDVKADEREAFVRTRAAGDNELCRDVLELLAADDDVTWIEPPSAADLSNALVGEDAQVGTRVGAWTIESLLGAGGMGRVYHATRHSEFEQRAAVKLIRRELSSPSLLERFHRERATLAKLEHPGIARLLDGGATDDGCPWLATEYVEGEQLDTWATGRSRDERLNAFEHVCDAVAYAHSQLVLHRDLKPANILVDVNDTPRLLDFGIAKSLREHDNETEITPVDPHSAITLDGVAPLTPAYASPEQRSGTGVGIPSDVFALGVILHELLTDEHPGDGGAARRPTSSRDFDAILARALAPAPAERYAHVADLVDDVRRARTHFPVEARGGAWSHRAVCFFRRHRVASILAASLLAVAVVAARQSYDALRLDQARLLDILRLSDGHRLRGLVTAMEGPLWPARDNADALDAWLADAHDLVARRDQHEARLATLTETLDAQRDDEQDDDDTRWWHEQLTVLTSALDDFTRDDPFGTTIASVEQRRRDHDEVVDASLGSDASDAWQRAIASIAESPVYGNVEITPQWGLVPLRLHEPSGLWEFADVQSGTVPTTRADDSLALDDTTAVVFVLLPGGRFAMGSQRSSATTLNYDSAMGPDESPVHNVELLPFFISKYEFTQGQWQRLRGTTPSRFAPPAHDMFPVSGRHPVEQVSWADAHETLRRHGWVLPSEAQWEYAARAGSDTPWSFGSDVAQLDTVANFSDLDARDLHGSSGWSYADAETHQLRDGHTIHAPVGSYAPNAFGLHDVHGNVWEWCRDMPMPYHPAIVIRPDGEREIPTDIGDLGTRILRGGAFSNPPGRLRSAARWSAETEFRSQVAGLRPARALDI